MRDSTIIYRSFYEAIKELPKTNQAEVWNAIFEFSLNFNEIELSGLSKTIFTLIKPQLQANISKFLNGNKPKQTKSKTEANDKLEESKTEGNENVNNNANENVNNNANENIPAYEVFLSYGLEKEPSVNTSALKNKYDAWLANDWKNGNDKPIKNWKSALLQTMPYIEKIKKTAPEGHYYNKEGILKRIIS